MLVSSLALRRLRSPATLDYCTRGFSYLSQSNLKFLQIDATKEQSGEFRLRIPYEAAIIDAKLQPS